MTRQAAWHLALALAREPYFAVMPPSEAAGSWLDDGFVSNALAVPG